MARIELEHVTKVYPGGVPVWQRVQADADSALASGARGTPTLFINGRRHLGGYDQPTLARPWPPSSRSDRGSTCD